MPASSNPQDSGSGLSNVLLWPWRVGRALALLPVSFQLQEGAGGKPGALLSQQAVPETLRPLHSKLTAALQPSEYVLVVPRALHSWQAGPQLFRHALAYNAVEASVKVLHLQSAAERLVSAGQSLLHGAAGYLDPSHPSHPVSLTNACAATFSLQGLYSPEEFPWSGPMPGPEADLHDPGTRMAHMLALTARLAYEDPNLIRQVVEDQWGCTFVASRSCRAADQHEAQDFATSWFAFATGSALVIAFCGEAAMHQLSWNAARSFHITKRGGLGGVDDTLFSLLLSRPKGPDGDRESLFDEVLRAVGGMLASRPLYLTGHGVGGALASLFALVLHLKRPHSSQQVAGIYTFGSCPAGDEAFVRKLQAAYPQRLVVHQHPGDVCSLWCPPGGYASPSGDACSALPQEVQATRSYLQRLLNLALWPLPGFFHHLPSEYEGALQSELLLSQFTDALPVSGPAHVILQLGSPSSPAHSPSARQLEPVQHSLLGSRGEMEDLLVSTGSDVFGDPQAADPPSLPSWQSTPVRGGEAGQLREHGLEGRDSGLSTPDSMLMAPAQPAQARHARGYLPPAATQAAAEEEHPELAALLAEWDEGDEQYASAQDSPRTSLMHSQQQHGPPRSQQDRQGASSILSRGHRVASWRLQSHPTATSTRSMHSAMSHLGTDIGQVQEDDRTEEFVGSTLGLMPSSARSPQPEGLLGNMGSSMPVPCGKLAGRAGSSCSSASGERIQASPTKHTGNERRRQSAWSGSPQKAALGNPRSSDLAC